RRALCQYRARDRRGIAHSLSTARILLLMTESVQSPASSSNKLLIGGAVAVVAVGALALFVVLPAEFGVDPTGVGKSLGLTEIAEPANEELERGSKRTGVLELS